jgi:succinate dehydrogenase/fumarate reductase flavoprotein subunit
VRPLEKSARKKGVEILLQHEMTRIVRENPLSGRVLGVTATDLKNNKSVSIRAKKAVITCTGGSSSNVHIRTIYDPRLTDVYCAGGDPWSRQSGAAEQCGMAIGASLGATSSARPETMVTFTKAMWIGSKDGYICWKPESPAFDRAGASGFFVADHQNTIHVNQLGNRFFDETAQRYANMNAHTGEDIDPSNKHVYDYLAAAVSSAVINGPNGAERVGGPIWVIFDADAAKREGWKLEPPVVDIKGGYFYNADSLAELAGKISQNRFQKTPMAAATLLNTVARYNSFVDSGKDVDFDKPAPKYKIQTGPFYAAWGTPVLHDCLTGLRINEKAQVMDVFGQVIPGFYCAGECAGGLTLHGLGKGVGIGYIAGTYAAEDA